MVASGPVVDERENDHHSWNHKVLVPEDADLPYSLSTEDGEVASPLNPRMDIPERPETDCTLEDDDMDTGFAVDVEPQHEDRIVPVAPPDVEVWKYYREERYSQTEAKVETIDALQEDFTRPDTPRNWREFAGSEGNQYFKHETLPFFTISNILEESRCQRVNAAVARLNKQLLEASRDLSRDVEVMVLCTYQDSEPVIGYYLAKLTTQTLMWFEPVHHNLVTQAERQPVSLPHLRLAMLSEFFHHVEIFCSHRPLPKAMFKEVKAAYRSGLLDVITSDNSMFSYDSETARQLSKVLKDFSDEDEISADATWSAARLLKTMYSDRYLAYYGEAGARCSRSDAAMEGGEHGPRSLPFLLVSMSCFFMPSVYLQELELLFMDKTVHYHAWRRFIMVARQDWVDSAVPALVLLAADVGLLIMQGIENQGVTRSVGQITGYTSAVLSLFVYVLCQILTRRHRHGKTEIAERALSYLQHAPLPCIAAVFSLPVALLLWSAIVFLASLMYTCLNRSNLATQITLGAVLGILAVLLGLLLYMEWQNDDKSPIKGFSLFSGECMKYFGSFKLFRRKHRAEKADEDVDEEMDEKVGLDDEHTEKDSKRNFESSSSCIKVGTSDTAGRRRGLKLWPWGSKAGLSRTRTRESDMTVV